MTPIELQDANMERLRRMRPIGPRASGVERHRQIRAARRKAKRMLHKLGHLQDDAGQLMRDVSNSWELNGRSDCKTA